jgi:hypothetical protein
VSIGFIDVTPGYWAYDDIIEGANTILEDGEPLLKGVPHQQFEPYKPYLYQDIKVTATTSTYTVSRAITPGGNHPLYVFVDGMPWPYRSTKLLSNNKQTQVVLSAPPKIGSVVTFISYGTPKLNSRGFPDVEASPTYPYYKLQNSATYTYYPQGGKFEYLTIFKKKLRRLMIPDAELQSMSGQELARKYIKDLTDVYLVTAQGYLVIPWNYEAVTGKFSYAFRSGGGIAHTEEEFVAYVGTMFDQLFPVRNDRFFPGMWVERQEVMVTLDKLRRYFYSRYTDQEAPGTELSQTIKSYNGQRVFKLNGYYVSGQGTLKVTKRIGKNNPNSAFITLVKDRDYTEFDDHTILLKEPVEEDYYFSFYYKKKVSPTLLDVGRNATYFDSVNQKLVYRNGTTASWVEPVLAMDSETFHDGSKLINGKPIKKFHDLAKTIPVVDQYWRPGSGPDTPKTYFMPYTPISRMEMVQFLNRFRKWCLERFL